MGFLDWLNQNIGQPLSKGVDWINQNIVQPVGHGIGDVAGTLFGQGAKDTVNQFTDALNQGNEFQKNGFQNGNWDFNKLQGAIKSGMDSGAKIFKGVTGALANPEGTIETAAQNLANNITSNPKVQQLQQSKPFQMAMQTPQGQKAAAMLKRAPQMLGQQVGRQVRQRTMRT